MIKIQGFWICSNCKTIQHDSKEQCPKCASVVKFFMPIQELEKKAQGGE